MGTSSIMSFVDFEDPEPRKSSACVHPPPCDPIGTSFDVDTPPRTRVRRAVSAMASVSMRNSETFRLGETGCEKFRNMIEVIEATNATLGVSN